MLIDMSQLITLLVSLTLRGFIQWHDKELQESERATAPLTLFDVCPLRSKSWNIQAFKSQIEPWANSVTEQSVFPIFQINSNTLTLTLLFVQPIFLTSRPGFRRISINALTTCGWENTSESWPWYFWHCWQWAEPVLPLSTNTLPVSAPGYKTSQVTDSMISSWKPVLSPPFLKPPSAFWSHLSIKQAKVP